MSTETDKLTEKELLRRSFPEGKFPKKLAVEMAMTASGDLLTRVQQELKAADLPQLNVLQAGSIMKHATAQTLTAMVMMAKAVNQGIDVSEVAKTGNADLIEELDKRSSKVDAVIGQVVEELLGRRRSRN